MNLEKSWYEANLYCNETYGTRLATIQSLSDNNAVRIAAALASINSGEDIWIGYIDIGSNGSWEWSNSDNYNMDDFTLWHGDTNEPNYDHDDIENISDSCAHLEPGYNDEWADYSCTTKWYFVCDLDLPTQNPTLLPTTAPTQNPIFLPTTVPTKLTNVSMIATTEVETQAESPSSGVVVVFLFLFIYFTQFITENTKTLNFHNTKMILITFQLNKMNRY